MSIVSNLKKNAINFVLFQQESSVKMKILIMISYVLHELEKNQNTNDTLVLICVCDLLFIKISKFFIA